MKSDEKHTIFVSTHTNLIDEILSLLSEMLETLLLLRCHYSFSSTCLFTLVLLSDFCQSYCQSRVQVQQGV